MNKAIVAKIAKQHALYRTEAKAKRRNLYMAASILPRGNGGVVAAAQTLNEATMMIVRTEAKAKAIEELAEALGIALEGE